MESTYFRAYLQHSDTDTKHILMHKQAMNGLQGDWVLSEAKLRVNYLAHLHKAI